MATQAGDSQATRILIAMHRRVRAGASIGEAMDTEITPGRLPGGMHAGRYMGAVYEGNWCELSKRAVLLRLTAAIKFSRTPDAETKAPWPPAGGVGDWEYRAA